ncbi:MAG: EAL domain-containing protein [Magnetococcales bacterium]|nr:EAL domain-containing protein [Magnetococcales bacterium]MBF0322595.1 EAL domain-containing protein [Magnetococcales bacterium]
MVVKRVEWTPHMADMDGAVLDTLLAAHIESDGDWNVSGFGPFRLKSAFQPIFSLSHQKPAGFEGLIRAVDRGSERKVTPKALFDHPECREGMVELDRLCQMLHILNFHVFAPERGWLFLNLNPRVVTEEPGFGAPLITSLLQRLGIPNHRLVIEILEKEIGDEGVLQEAITHYQENGCLIALDDFGAGESNFDRIWRLQPEIVKLDRSIIVNSVHNQKARRMLPSLVSLIHEAGCLALIEGIETRDEAMIAIDSEADLVQGYYFSTPECDLDALEGAGEKRVDFLTREFRDTATLDGRRQMRDLSRFLVPFLESFRQSDNDASIVSGCMRFLGMQGVMRCFILDGYGHQVGENLTMESPVGKVVEKYHIMAGVHGADWSRRHYFRRAMARPGEVQVTDSYLSLPDACMCVTLSLALPRRDGTVRVVCADLAWDGAANIASGSAVPCLPNHVRVDRRHSSFRPFALASCQL